MNVSSLVVDGSFGVFSWNRLVEAYSASLFVENADTYIELESYLDGREDYKDESLETVFNPDNHLYCDNIDDLSDKLRLKVGDEYWKILQEDGDIFAIHQDAIWDEDSGQWILEQD